MRRTTEENRQLILALAKVVDDFCYDCDPEDYQERMAGIKRRRVVEDIASDIADGNIDYISSYICYEADHRRNCRYDDAKEIERRAKDILSQLYTLGALCNS